MLKLLVLVFLLFISIAECRQRPWAILPTAPFADRPCNGSDEISISYQPGLPPGEENKYQVHITLKVPEHSVMNVKFDTEASITLIGETAASSRVSVSGDTFNVRFFKQVGHISFIVRGSKRGTIPYFKSLEINRQEYCDNPKVGYLDEYIEGYRDTAAIELSAPDGCGRRKVEHTELIVNGEVTKAGDWPWHVAIYKRDGPNIKYIGGGTLISKTVVLTAAHCASIRGIPVAPEILSVVLGKYNLIGGDLETQEREVYSVIIHEDFAPKEYLSNDIALLKLKTEATYNDYVQPACIWNSRLSADERDFGTVVGWGFDQTDSLSSQLKQATMPIIPDVTCIKKNPLFYANVLNNDKKFCAGWANGTSACNGDSGGGLLVFVPDNGSKYSANPTGAYYVRGIVSISAARKDIALCDPYQYVVFTDVGKYHTWIQKHLEE